jgi:hypothetical protein
VRSAGDEAPDKSSSLLGLLETLAQADDRRRVPLPAGRALDPAPVQFRRRRQRRQVGEFPHDGAHALNRRRRFLRAALAPCSPSAELHAAPLRRREALLRAFRDQRPLFLGQGGVEMKGSASAPSSDTMNGTLGQGGVQVEHARESAGAFCCLSATTLAARGGEGVYGLL